MRTYLSTDVEELEEVAVAEDTGSEDVAYLLVYNDDHNTFEHVIGCFQDILQYDCTQAEQLAMLIHFKGKATVKTAAKHILRPEREALVDRGLSAVIEG